MMNQYQNPEDTIAAISTAAGSAGIGMVRLSGRDAIAVAERIFVSKKAEPLSRQPSHTVHYGHIVSNQTSERAEFVDEVLLTIMRAPRTYTCEDIVEISCHGGVFVQKKILSLALESGARLAEPGEFTKRAFLNGRIDLTQAEAVLDIIHAKSEAFLKASTHQLKGELTIELESIRGILMKVYTELEAALNFPDDDTEGRGRERIRETLGEAKERIRILLRFGEQGRILKEGIKIVLCGKANVGKSSLLNVLLKQPRAIVSHIEGTTRDTIEETVQIQGVALQLVDTAGILEPRDMIEQEAVKRSELSIQSADLVLFILDGTRGVSLEDQKIVEKIKGRKNVMIVINKCDLDEKIDIEPVAGFFPGAPLVRVSALKKTGVDRLEQDILSQVLHGNTIDPRGVLLTNLRHIQSLKACYEKVVKGEGLMTEGFFYELISEEIKRAVTDLDAITGRDVDMDLVDRIFSDFCIGK